MLHPTKRMSTHYHKRIQNFRASVNIKLRLFWFIFFVLGSCLFSLSLRNYISDLQLNVAEEYEKESCVV